MNSPVSDPARNSQLGHSVGMLTEAYIEALLVDEELADQVWELWNAGAIADDIAALAWAC